jgi:hypothetical protein
MTLASKDQRVIDIHDYVKKAAAARRAQVPTFTLTTDGIHPGADGHRWMAEALDKGLFEAPSGIRILPAEPGRASLSRAGGARVLTLPWEGGTADAAGRSLPVAAP